MPKELTFVALSGKIHWIYHGRTMGEDRKGEFFNG